MVTYRLKDLRAATRAIQIAEAQMGGKSNMAAKKLNRPGQGAGGQGAHHRRPGEQKGLQPDIQEEAQEGDHQGDGPSAEIEQAWDTEVKANYSSAKALAEKAASML